MERLKCGAGEGWRISVGLIMWEMQKYYIELSGALILYKIDKKRQERRR